jgi:rare lipoprotein A
VPADRTIGCARAPIDCALAQTDRAKARAPRLTARLSLRLAALGCALALAGCGTFSGRSGDRPPDSGKRGGGYYLDDGPGDNPPANLDQIPDAVPRLEPLVPGTARPYTAMGRAYTPMTQFAPYRARGMATWYGRRYHGQRTASGEIYDMYAMTGAHPVLPIPSYARVTNLDNGRSVVVRINDRGPFLDGRLIDLSYAAAYKLDIVRNGSSRVEVEAILPGSTPEPPAAITAEAAPPAAAAAMPPAAVTAVPSAAVGAVQAKPLPEPSASQSDGFYVQLGAFSVRDNAERFLERMRISLAAFDVNLSIVSSGSLHRVHAGPYVNRDGALAVAEQITQSLGTAPVLVAPH